VRIFFGAIDLIVVSLHGAERDFFLREQESFMYAFDESRGPLYFLSTDLDRANEAADRALAFGLPLLLLFPKEQERLAEAAAVLIDLDYLCLDAGGVRRQVAELLAAPPVLPLALIGYNGEDEMGGKLRDGVAWFRALSDGPFDWLARQLAPASGSARFRVRDVKRKAA
jgi:hypothetical protein